MNNNIKAQFFAQYLNQIVVRHESDTCLFRLTEISFIDLKVGIWGDWSGGTHPQTAQNDLIGIDAVNLELRTVEQLNQNELLQVGIKAFPMFVPFPEKDYDTLRKLALTVLDRGHLSWVTRQTLIGYGALVPFLYIDENNKPVTLSPAELINSGWVMIK